MVILAVFLKFLRDRGVNTEGPGHFFASDFMAFDVWFFAIFSIFSLKIKKHDFAVSPRHTGGRERFCPFLSVS